MNDLILGAPIVALVPGLVELAKRAGLSPRYAGLAAIAGATALMALADVAGVAGFTSGAASGAVRVASWLLAGIVYGLAAAGLYSQTRRFPPGAGAAPDRPDREAR